MTCEIEAGFFFTVVCKMLRVKCEKCVALMVLFVVFLLATLPLSSTHFHGFDKEERSSQRLLNRLYFVATTLSTVGYGDTSPKSGIAKSLSVAAMMCLMLIMAS